MQFYDKDTYIRENILAEAVRRGCTSAGTVCAPSPTQIRHITAVGAYFDRRDKNAGKNGILSSPDIVEISRLLTGLEELGIVFCDDFVIDVVNLGYGRDFLKETNQTDMVISCFVYQPSPADIFLPHNNKFIFDKKRAEVGACPIDIEDPDFELIPESELGGLWFSTSAQNLTSWNDRLKCSNAKIVWSIGSGSANTITVEQMCGMNDQFLIIADGLNSRAILPENDYNMGGSFGLAFETRFLEQTIASFSYSSTLAERIQMACKKIPDQQNSKCAAFPERLELPF